MVEKVTLRVDRANPSHVHCTLFMDGANCGSLVLKPEECEFLRSTLLATDRLVAGFHGISFTFNDTTTGSWRSQKE